MQCGNMKVRCEILMPPNRLLRPVVRECISARCWRNRYGHFPSHSVFTCHWECFSASWYFTPAWQVLNSEKMSSLNAAGFLVLSRSGWLFRGSSPGLAPGGCGVWRPTLHAATDEGPGSSASDRLGANFRSTQPRRPTAHALCRQAVQFAIMALPVSRTARRLPGRFDVRRRAEVPSRMARWSSPHTLYGPELGLLVPERFQHVPASHDGILAVREAA